MDPIQIKEDFKVIFANAMLNKSIFFDVAMAKVKIKYANPSDLVIEGAVRWGLYSSYRHAAERSPDVGCGGTPALFAF